MDLSLKFLSLLVICGSCCGDSSPKDQRASIISFPTTGFNLCNKVKDRATKLLCIKCFQDANKDLVEASNCMKHLPKQLARCSQWMENGNTNEVEFKKCIRRGEYGLTKQIKRANMFRDFATPHLTKVANNTIVEGGAAAIFSIMAQDLLFCEERLQDYLNTSSHHCPSRFEVDPDNMNWHINNKTERPSWWPNNNKNNKKINNNNNANKHINKRSLLTSRETPTAPHLPERSLVYEYGAVGHDMPFHGAGPCAKGVLSGKCSYESLRDDGHLDDLLETIYDLENPVPAWIFREILNDIGEVNLPTLDK